MEADMPTYDYRCEGNGRVVEVNHPMSEQLDTWGDLCSRTGIELGSTPANSPVARLATGGQVVSKSSLSNPEAPSCGMGGCGTGMCGLQ
jgi:hypothetical protein